MSMHPDRNPGTGSAARAQALREESAAWARLPATGWKVFALMAPIAAWLYLSLSALLASGNELPLLVSLIAHSRLTYLLLPALAPMLAYASLRLRHTMAFDPRRLAWVLHSLLLAFALLAVAIIWVIGAFQ